MKNLKKLLKKGFKKTDETCMNFEIYRKGNRIVIYDPKHDEVCGMMNYLKKQEDE